MSTSRIVGLFGFVVAVMQVLAAGNSTVLWQIGKPDNQDAELSLAPAQFSQFKADGLFVVGESDARRDWPYVHPGPDDAWAGAKPHTFMILFGLKAPLASKSGECHLDFDLLDTQSRNPPRLLIEINGRAFDHATPAGGGDDSVRGHPAKGLEHKFSIAFPSTLLKAGDNEVRITTRTGSWLLYDAISMTAPPGAELTAIESRTVLESIQGIRALRPEYGQKQEPGQPLFQPIEITLRHFGEDATASIHVEGNKGSSLVPLSKGKQRTQVLTPAVTETTSREVTIEARGKILARRQVMLKPVRKLTVYVLPHSHTDIGYTEIQTAIEKKQVQNLVDGMAAAKRTAAYPAGSRFIWNVEVAWAADLYLHRLDEKQRTEFFDAVRQGQVVLNGMYLNELTGLCRPEELVRLFEEATRLAKATGVPIESAMISDVPGYTWGTVTAMAQAGIKYFSTAPNYFDRIGTILREWENKPFYWVAPDGKSKVLVWIPFWGYAMSHRYGKFSPQLVEDFSDGLEKKSYPFDIAYVRWSGHGDNAVPDPAICEFIKEWNKDYAYPRFVISGTSDAFRALEQRYGDKLPTVRGDWTPYWEDGAASSALETAMNRASSDRLAQAETLFAMLKPANYPSDRFEAAWKNVLLYSEHTWGADCSISQPESQKTREQWEIKKGYAEAAHRQSEELLTAALKLDAKADASNTIEVLNTASWPRTELVTLSQELSGAGDCVMDERGGPVPCQRLHSGEMAFMASVPALSSRHYKVGAGPRLSGRASAKQALLENGKIRVRVDEKTGGIAELTFQGKNFADTTGGETLNDYLYLPGDDLKDLKRNGQVTIRVGDAGPLVASLIIESSAPGCRKLTRELRVVDGLDFVEILNVLDKERLAAKSYHAKEGKEAVNFGFPFAVPDGEVLLDLPLGLARPDEDQMPSACKNWFTVGRWADVSNKDRGITCVTLDAPLVQVGGITATLLNSQTNPDVWRKKAGRTQKIYWWAMNNHWGTNYRAYQDGRTVFRFVLRPHGQRNAAETTRFATGFSQPLLARRAAGPDLTPLVSLNNPDAVVTGLKPSWDGKAIVARVFGAAQSDREVKLNWQNANQVFFSGTAETRGATAPATLKLSSGELVTLRAELERK